MEKQNILPILQGIADSKADRDKRTAKYNAQQKPDYKKYNNVAIKPQTYVDYHKSRIEHYSKMILQKQATLFPDKNDLEKIDYYRKCIHESKQKIIRAKKEKK